MAYKFRHQLRYVITALLLASLVVSCSKNDILSSPDTDSPEIDFSTPSLSRGVVASSDDMSAFDVWGWYSPTTGNGAQTQVFEARKVTNTGSGWKYDIPERWQQGNTYRFYAVYPSKDEDPKYQSANYDESGNLAITNFDCSYAVDLMTASEEVVCYDNGYPGKVNMTFSHELARVRFIGKRHGGTVGIPNFNPIIISAKLYGMYKIGSLSASKDMNQVETKIWTIDRNSVTFESLPFIEKDYEKKEITFEGFNIFDDILMLPQEIEVSYYLEVVYSTDSGKTTRNIKTQLVSMPVKKWESGKSYLYSFTISADDRILFDKPVVDEWGEATGGIIIVD